MGPSRTDFTRKIDYSAIPDGQVALDNAVLRLIKGIRGTRKHPIHLLDILSWFRGAPQPMVLESIHRHLDDNLIVAVPGTGGYRIKTFGDVVKERKLAKVSKAHLVVLNEIANPKA
jgi:hypothetical protein